MAKVTFERVEGTPSGPVALGEGTFVITDQAGNVLAQGANTVLAVTQLDTVLNIRFAEPGPSWHWPTPNQTVCPDCGRRVDGEPDASPKKYEWCAECARKYLP